MKMNFKVIFRYFIFMVSLSPLGILITRAFTDHLGANPVEKITHFTGSWTLKFILIALCVTPLKNIISVVFKWYWTDYTRTRRMLGLFAFFYACLHFLAYVALDRFFDFHDISKDIAKRPYITVGFTAFVLLIPLAVTSTKKMQKRLGKNWKRLHRIIYLIAVFAVIHFYWLVKADKRWPIIYGIILMVVFVLRILFQMFVRKKY